MIVNSLNEDKIKILIDENDLKKANISLATWISNSDKTLTYIGNLLNFPSDLTIKDYSIYTYNYKIFLITLYL